MISRHFFKKNKSKKQWQIKKVYYNIPMHYLRYHPTDLSGLRIWILGKALDVKGSGTIDTDKLIEQSGIEKQYFLTKISPNSGFFINTKHNKTILKSINKVAKEHHLSLQIWRKEKITKKFIGQFRSKAAFCGYILKCFAENDLSKKYKNRYTAGRISYQLIAQQFNLSRGTAIRLLNNSTAKIMINIIHSPEITFKYRYDFNEWLQDNMDKVHKNLKVNENLSAFKLKRKSDGTYYLTQQMPNIYKFTGVAISRLRSKKKRGNPRKR